MTGARVGAIDSADGDRKIRTKVEQERCELCGKRLVPGRWRSCLRALRSRVKTVLLRRQEPRRAQRSTASPDWSPAFAGELELPEPPQPTLSELFAAHPCDGGWAGFLLAQIDHRQAPAVGPGPHGDPRERARPSAGAAVANLIHVEARDAKDALWAMEEGVRCSALSSVIGELWGDPRALDFTATRRLAVASERSGMPCWLVRLGGTANLSGARMRWRIGCAPSLLNPLDPRAPGAPAWDAELFRARGMPRPLEHRA